MWANCSVSLKRGLENSCSGQGKGWSPYLPQYHVGLEGRNTWVACHKKEQCWGWQSRKWKELHLWLDHILNLWQSGSLFIVANAHQRSGIGAGTLPTDRTLILCQPTSEETAHYLQPSSAHCPPAHSGVPSLTSQQPSRCFSLEYNSPDTHKKANRKLAFPEIRTILQFFYLQASY